MRLHKIMLLSLLERGGTLSAKMFAREISSDIGKKMILTAPFLKGLCTTSVFYFMATYKTF